MGKGGTTKSTSNTTTVSGQNAIQGDNLGTAISGVNNSTITVSDHGAIEKASELAELSINSNTDVSKAAMGNVKDFASEQLNAFSEAQYQNSQQMQAMLGNQAAQNARNLETLTSLASQQADGGQIETTAQMASMLKIIAIAIAVAFVAIKVAK